MITQKFIYIVTTISAFLIAAVAHEVCHGYVAYLCGDTTAKDRGRLSLNPLVHLDPIGSVLVPVLLIILQTPFVFGWAKPVPVDYRQLRNPKRDIIFVSLAGPGINFLLSIICAIILKVVVLFQVVPMVIQVFLLSMIIVNLVLALFNLIPIPPLDGSKVLMGLLPTRFAYYYSKIEPYGFFILILLLSLGFVRNIIWPLIQGILHFYGIY